MLKERERQSAGTLSGGQQQQLAIARAMIGEPVMMLLDEPSEGIQPSIVQEIARHIRALNAEAGMTVLFVEQNLDLIVSLADRGLVMDKGRIVARLDGADIRVPRRGEALSGAVKGRNGMSWIEQSLMARKGVARGKEGARHTITIEDQGKYHYVYGPYVEPVLTVAPGAVVTGDPRRLRGQDQLRERQALRPS